MSSNTHLLHPIPNHMLVSCVLIATACSAPNQSVLKDPRSQARSALESGRLQQAQRIAEHLANSGAISDQMLLASVWVRQGKHSATVHLLEPLFAQHPKNARLASLLARSLDAIGEGEKALKVYARRLRLVPDDTSAAIRFAQLLFQRGNPAQAAEVAAAALKTNPPNYALLTILARCQLRRGRLPMARKAAAAAMQLAPERAEAWVVFARIEAARGELAEAEKAVRTALTHAPQHIEALRFSAALHSSRGDLATAAKCMDRAIAVRPDDPRLLNEFAVVQFRLKHFQAATLALERAIRISPRQLTLYRNLLEVLLAAGQLDAAAELLQASITLLKSPQAQKAKDKLKLEDSVIRTICALELYAFVNLGAKDSKELSRRIDSALEAAGLHLTPRQRDAAAQSAIDAVKSARQRNANEGRNTPATKVQP